MLNTPSGTVATASSARAQRLKLLRKLHLYFGLFIAPALMFFAFTGAMQTLSLHEAAGTSYTPPQWLARLGQLHKDQNIKVRPPRPAPPQAGGSDHGHTGPAQPANTPPQPQVTLGSKESEHFPEKLFFLAVALGLFSSTFTGIYMAYIYERNRVLVTGLLLAGIVVPLLLLPF